MTRGRHGIVLPNPKYANLTTTTTLSSPPGSVHAALRDLTWRQAMQEEYDALVSNGTWTLVPRLVGANVITGKWIFKNKLNLDGTLERRKARWVVRGFNQRAGVDSHQTFSPVVKPATIRTVLHLAASRSWPTTYLLVYVDDILLTASTSDFLAHIVKLLRQEFAMKDLGDIRFFLGVQVRRDEHGFFLNQAQYAEDILEHAGMLNCKSAPTPVDTKPKLSLTEGALFNDPTFYRSIVGALQYLTLTRPDLAYAVNQACLFMHAPREVHWGIVKRILRYLRGTLDNGLRISASPTTHLTAYSDADWAGCPDTRRSTLGYCVFLGDSLVSWSSKR
ncbi:uncharacterized mitochondrial protein AtMg00810-like [Miscanthus floridulus]|uniref:uncharacterized mitochondrial protein AtMg00810-like n=1 Tax=Miscanthus floridulus TaxID=154761 RepID=UPI003458A5C9